MAIADRMKIGIGSPHIFPDGNVDMTFAASFARRAEELGYASLWTQERVTGSPTTLHPLSFLAWLAGQTTTARIGVSVLVLPRHNPVLLAKLAADIDVMSGGRLVFGVGLGNSASELPMYGITAERRVTRFVEQVEAIRALWTQTPSGHCRHRSTICRRRTSSRSRCSARIRPSSSARTPTPPSRAACAIADGWMGAGSGPLADFPRKVALVQSHLAEAGRDPASFPISKRLYLAVDDDESRALRRLREWFGYYYGNADNAEHAAIWGSAAKIGELLEEWTEMGVNEVLLNPVFDMEDHLERLADITGLA